MCYNSSLGRLQRVATSFCRPEVVFHGLPLLVGRRFLPCELVFEFQPLCSYSCSVFSQNSRALRNKASVPGLAGNTLGSKPWNAVKELKPDCDCHGESTFGTFLDRLLRHLWQ